MKESHIDKTRQYIESLTPSSSAWAQQLEAYALEHRVPIIEASSMHFIKQQLAIHQPKRILEIGTAIGYSALCMHEMLPEAEIISLEKNEEMYELALGNIKSFAKNDNIKVLKGDAVTLLEQFAKEEMFDFVFIDAAKGQYERFFQLINPLVPLGGLIISDNILFRGYVTGNQEDIPKRFQTLVTKLKRYNGKMMNNEAYHSSIIPIGDGLLMSLKV
ncbi:MAG TPA: O-methyltransferase [Pseudogracilibacillus sp.]|nr:O-methyltransferase [Pseudogracilibacillus sp.]